MLDFKILVTDENKVNLLVAKEFAKYCNLILGETPEIVDKDGDYNIVAIGNETENTFVQNLYFEKTIEKLPLCYGTEQFLIKSQNIGSKKVLFIAGARPRATFYAMYHYFEKFLGVRYFWDGERIPKANTIPLENINVFEKPRFDYRGQRYFSHRGLHRYQAEHWSFEDWKKEIDWLLKKKLNYVALFIGLDDLFQKVFPDVVDYESVENEYFGAGYENRKSFWPLKYRGELRKKVLDYLHERDLISAENSGTLTHWNTKTPQKFLDYYKPDFFIQTKASGYSDERALVWDIRKQKNFDLYFDLTKGLVEFYGKEGFFYTIGFAERNFSEDKEKNLRMKLFCYHKLLLRLQQEYPNSKLFICGWDLWFNNFTTEEMEQLVSSLNPENVIIMDYNSDTYRKHNFTKWALINRFPHTFGLFHGYEMNSDIRGDYDLSHKRLKLTLKDKQCVGFMFWPELSHSDTFMLEYYPLNAWSPLKETLKDRVYNFCFDRYLKEDFDKMYSVWQKFFPIVKLMHWNMEDNKKAVMPIEYFFNINWRYKIDTHDFYDAKLPKFMKLRKDCIDIIKSLKDYVGSNDEMLKRDCFDIIKTVVGRFIHYNLVLAKTYYDKTKMSGNSEKLFNLLTDCRTLIVKLGEILGCYSEYTLNDSLNQLKSVHDIPEDFDYVLKDNAYNGYCRSYVYELFDNLFIKEYDMFLFNLQTSLSRNEPIKVDMEKEKAIFDGFLNKPLKEMQPKRNDIERILCETCAVMEKMLKYGR